jgi:hypothetical protein
MIRREVRTHASAAALRERGLPRESARLTRDPSSVRWKSADVSVAAKRYN